MKYFIDVSDKRNQFVKAELVKRGYQVSEFNLGAEQGAKGDCYIFSPAKKFNLEELQVLPAEITVFCGKIDKKVQKFFLDKKIRHLNFLDDEIFAIQNASLTVEGVLGIMIAESPKSMLENKVLILGGGRLAKAMMILLGKLGVAFSVCMRNLQEFEMAHLFTEHCFLLEDLGEHLAEFDIIVNTVPSNIIDEAMMKKIQPDALFIETASVDGLDRAKVRGFRFYHAPALPQKYCLESAGRLVLKKVLEATND